MSEEVKTPLDVVREWIATYPGHDILSEFQCDYTDQIPSSGGIFPSGLLEVSREKYIRGSFKVENQLNFGLYYVFLKAPGDDVTATVNADWVMDFQRWVQETDPPKFGDRTLSAVAQNGALYSSDEEGTATYMIQLSINYEKFIKKGVKK